MINFLRNLITSKKGQGLPEYALILAGVVAFVVLVVASLAENSTIHQAFTKLLSDIAGKIKL